MMLQTQKRKFKRVINKEGNGVTEDIRMLFH